MSLFLILGDIDFAKDFFGCSGVKNKAIRTEFQDVIVPFRLMPRVYVHGHGVHLFDFRLFPQIKNFLPCNLPCSDSDGYKLVLMFLQLV